MNWPIILHGIIPFTDDERAYLVARGAQNVRASLVRLRVAAEKPKPLAREQLRVHVRAPAGPWFQVRRARVHAGRVLTVLRWSLDVDAQLGRPERVDVTTIMNIPLVYPVDDGVSGWRVLRNETYPEISCCSSAVIATVPGGYYRALSSGLLGERIQSGGGCDETDAP